jgi:hypothetical protein
MRGVDVSNWHVFPSLHEEAREGWVWASEIDDPAAPHIMIRNSTSGRRVVCEQRLIDDNFRRVYNDEGRVALPQAEAVLVVSAYYRQRLGIPRSAGSPIELDISTCHGPIASLRAGLAHPSSAVRTATWLGLLSLALGLLSVALVFVIPRL